MAHKAKSKGLDRIIDAGLDFASKLVGGEDAGPSKCWHRCAVHDLKAAGGTHSGDAMCNKPPEHDCGGGQHRCFAHMGYKER